MEDVRLCAYCHRALRKQARSHAEYCSDPCRVRSNRLRGHLGQLPIVIQRAARALTRQAPAEAVAYRLILGTPKHFWVYPPSRPSLRWDGTRSRRAGFSLWPFEPPIVPVDDIYGIRFVERGGGVLVPSGDLLEGLRVVPLATINIEDGDRWR